MIDRSIRFITQGIAVFLIGMLGVLVTPDAQAQTINQSSSNIVFTDVDGDGWAEPNDHLNFFIVIDGVVYNQSSGSPDTTTTVHIDYSRYNGNQYVISSTSNGSNGDGTGNAVQYDDSGNDRDIDFGTDLSTDALNGASASDDSASINIYVVLEEDGTPYDTVATWEYELTDATEGIDNWRPVFADAIASDTLRAVENAGNANWTGIGDDIVFEVEASGDDPTLAYVRVNQGVFNGTNNFDAEDLSDFDLPGFGSITNGIEMQRSGNTFSGSATLIEGFIYDETDPNTGYGTGATYEIADEAGNTDAGTYGFTNLHTFIDNEAEDMSDEATPPNVPLEFEITDATTDGISGAAIVDTEVRFIYDYSNGTGTPPEQVESVVMDLSQFGGSATASGTYDETDDVFYADLTLSESAGIDGDVSDYPFDVTLTDSAGNVFEGPSDIIAGDQEIDLESPGSPEIALTINEGGNPNSLLNAGEDLDVTISGLNNDTYSVYINNENLNTDYDAEASNVSINQFLNNGDDAGSEIFNATSTTTGSISGNGSIEAGSFNEGDTPEGLDIEADATAGTITFHVRDDAGNETSVTATIPYPVDNIVPTMLTTQTIALSDDADGNGVANIGDELSATFEDPDQSDIESVYLEVNSRVFGNVGQEEYTNYDFDGNDLGDDDGGAEDSERPDWLRLTESSGTFSTSIDLYADQDEDFTGTNQTAGNLTTSYYLVDDAGNRSNSLTTDALTEAFDNQVPNTDPSATNQLTGPNTVSVGVSMTAEYSTSGDAESVEMDLSAYGGSATQALTDDGGGNFSYTFATTEQEDTPDVEISDQDEGPDGVRIPVTVTDENGNTSNGFARLDFQYVDLQLPTPVTSDDISYMHVDDNSGDSRDNNGLINDGEYIRITIDVSENPDFANPTGGFIELGLEAFGEGTPQITAGGGGIPAPRTAGSGYDSDNKRFVYAFNVDESNNVPNAAAGAASIEVRNIQDNGGNETNPSDEQSEYVELSIEEAIDATPPQIVGTPTFEFSTNTDVNGDGIAAVGDEVTISSQITGADSVVLDARYLGLGFINMTNTSGDTWEIDAEVAEATDMLYASDDDDANTALPVTAFDTGGNSASQNSSALAVDNVSVKAPQLHTTQLSDGRIELSIDAGQSTDIRGGTTISFDDDMDGGSVAGTSDYLVYSDQGSGTIDYNTPVATINYTAGTDTYTSPEYADGEVVQYAVRPVDDAGNEGAVSLTASNSADAVVTTATWLEPADSTVFANTSNRNISVDVDEDIASVQFRVRAADIDPNTTGFQPGDWADLDAVNNTVSGGVLSVSVDGDEIVSDASESSINSEYQIIPVLTDDNGNTQTDAEALAENGHITVFADIFDPEVEIVAIDDSTWDGINSNNTLVGAMVSGETSFTYRVEDQYDIDPQVAEIDVQINNTSIANTTISQHIFAGRLSIDGNLFTITLDMTPYNGTTPQIEIIVDDGRDNSFSTPEQDFEVVDNVAPLYTLSSPATGSKFNTSIGFGINTNYQVGDQANIDEVKYELSNTEDFSGDVYLLGTGGTGATINIPSEVAALLTSGETYYVRAIAEDGNFNEYTTNVQSVVYDTDLPEVSLSFPDAITVNGQETITGTSRIEISTDDDDVTSVSLEAYRPDDAATERGTNSAADVNSTDALFARNFNTTANAGGANTNFDDYQGQVLIYVDVTDDAGNTYTGQVFSIYVDNNSPTFEIVSVNEDQTMETLAPMQAGSDTVTVEVMPTMENEVTFAEAMLDVEDNNGGQTVNVMGEVMENGNYLFRFPLPDYSDNQTIDFANDLDFSLRDTLGNETTGALNQNSLGDLEVIGNGQADIFFTDLADGLRLTGNMNGVGNNLASIDYEHFGNISNVHLEVMESGQSDFQQVSTTGTPGNDLTLNTTNYPDGEIHVRLVAETANEEEFISDTLTVMVDNTFDPATERATIVDYAGARLGGGNITLTANGLDNTGAVEFRVRRTDDNSGYTAIGNTAVKNPDGSFSIAITPEEIADELGVNVSDLTGTHELIAVAQDDAGYEYVRILENTPTWGTSGNEDIEDDVVTTTIEFDFMAPQGFFALNGSPLTNDQTETWDDQVVGSFNALTESVDMAATVNDGVEDFSRARVIVQRFANEGVGTTINEYTGSSEAQLLAEFTDANDIAATLDPADFVQDGVYRLEVEFFDDLGNQSTSNTYDFVVGEPVAWINSYNAVHGELYLQASPHAQSAMVEMSSDGGSTYELLQNADLSGVNTGSNLDGYRTATVDLTGSEIPEGTISLRVTASEQEASDVEQSRFNNSPTVLELDVAYTNGSSGLNGAQDILTTWTPTGESSSSLGLVMNKSKGDITDLRLEVLPESDQDQVSLVTVTDNNLYSDRNNLSMAVNPAYRESDDNGLILEYHDGVHFGLGNTINPGVGSGGEYVAFATNVLPDGSVDMVRQSVRVEQVAANRGGTVMSSDEGFSLEIPEFINNNVGVYVEEDPSNFRSSSAQQLDWMQISSAYWVNASASALESGYPATVTMSYSDDDIMDSNRDGSIDAQDEMELAVVTVNGSLFNAGVTLMNKVIDTGNNTVSFEVSSLPTNATRYTLIQKGVAQANPGSMTVQSMRFGSVNGANYMQPNNASFNAIVADQISSIATGSIQLFINDVVLNTNAIGGNTPLSTSTNNQDANGNATVVRVTAGTYIDNLGLAEGTHNSMFVADNNNGNRIIEEVAFMIDNQAIGVDAVTTHVGPNSEMTFAVNDAAAGDTSGSGLNISSFYVDVYANVIAEDSSGAKVERVRYLQRVSPEQIDYVGSIDSLMATFNVNVDEEEGEVASLSYWVIDPTNNPSLDNQNGQSDDHVNFGPNSYDNGDGILDRAGNRSNVQQYRAKYDNTAPEAEVMSSVVETGIRIRLTDDGAGVDSTSITITSISSEGESSSYTVASEEVSYNENSGILTFDVAEFGSTVEIEVADNVGNVAVAEAVSESLQLSVSDFHIFPNPFDPVEREATVEFILSKEAQVSIEGLDFNGRKVIELANDETFAPGVQQMSFAGNAIDGQQLANGVYFLRIVVKNGDEQEEQVFKAVVAKR